jgi:hypothetical protein
LSFFERRVVGFSCTFDLNFTFPGAFEVFGRFAKLSHALSHRPGKLRQFTGSKENQRDHEDEQ